MNDIFMEDTPYFIAAFYHFALVEDKEGLRGHIAMRAKELGIVGTILVADEGINGTVAGDKANILSLLGFLRDQKGFDTLKAKYSSSRKKPFLRLKVRLKKEIVSMGVEAVNGDQERGHYVTPKDWNALIQEEDICLIDTRNDYEVAIGTFQGALNPRTQSFRDFPAWFEQLQKGWEKSGKKPSKIAMFCTGGVRCEKATSFVKSKGIGEVYHLDGGILKYLEEIGEQDSMWKGDCFLFDGRVAVGHGLQQGDYTQCYACRRPLDAEQRASCDYIKGVSCPHCIDERNGAQRRRYAERQKQMGIAEKNGTVHLGDRKDIGG